VLALTSQSLLTYRAAPIYKDRSMNTCIVAITPIAYDGISLLLQWIETLAIDDFHCFQVLSRISAVLSDHLHKPTQDLIPSRLLLLISSTANRAGLCTTSPSYIITDNRASLCSFAPSYIITDNRAGLCTTSPSYIITDNRAGLCSFAPHSQQSWPLRTRSLPRPFHYSSRRS